MNITKSQMAGNVYNRTDADTWMTVPTFAQTRKSSFLDASSLEKYDKNFLEGWDREEAEIDFKDLYKKH